jgi:hypothetical protein
MSGLSQEDIRAIIDKVERRLGDVATSDRPASTLQARAELAVSQADLGEGIYRTIDEAVAAAGRAQVAYAAMGLEKRKAIVESMRQSMLSHGDHLARLAHTETGLGRYEDKVRKNRIVTLKTPGPEDLEPVAITGDQGMAVVEWAPFGLIGAITPGAVRADRCDHSDDESDFDDHQQRDSNRVGRQCGHLQRSSERKTGVGREYPSPEPGDCLGRWSTGSHNCDPRTDDRFRQGIDAPSRRAGTPRHRWAGRGA